MAARRHPTGPPSGRPSEWNEKKWREAAQEDRPRVGVCCSKKMRKGGPWDARGGRSEPATDGLQQNKPRNQVEAKVRDENWQKAERGGTRGQEFRASSNIPASQSLLSSALRLRYASHPFRCVFPFKVQSPVGLRDSPYATTDATSTFGISLRHYSTPITRVSCCPPLIRFLFFFPFFGAFLRDPLEKCIFNMAVSLMKTVVPKTLKTEHENTLPTEPSSGDKIGAEFQFSILIY